MSAAWIDAARPVRSGEALDLDRLAPYLQQALDMPGAPVSALQFPGGHSNLTYLVRIGERELVLRRPPFGAQIKTAHDMDREYAFLSRLAPVYPRVPRPLLLGDEAVLGARFYVMERVRGVVLRSRLPPGLTIGPELARGLSVAAAETLAELHALDIHAAGLAPLGHPDGYVRRQVEGWSRRYAAAVTDEIPAMERVAAWLAEHLPDSGPPTLIHNDFKYDNLVLDPDDLTQVRGVLDWEMATIGDPLMDLGTALCYWVEASDPPELRAFAFGPTALPGSYTRREFAEHYARVTGRSLAQLPFYSAFGLYKTAVVAQQIYLRYVRGHSQDARFAMMIVGVRALADQAERVLAGA
ncbi:MAG: phosphotransferase family protein [Nannocystis sp.]|uniref:phosphotransferase family protein n=1 Tax=Nannocystis sp. TaxID=1962667 RepID=UPI002422B00A|nr:phosphotransferase family protein [Nannocystis sp.]MBK9755350.1 phosphotransferase family protein [Nannocystis sp.]